MIFTKSHFLSNIYLSTHSSTHSPLNSINIYRAYSVLSTASWKRAMGKNAQDHNILLLYIKERSNYAAYQMLTLPRWLRLKELRAILMMWWFVWEMSFIGSCIWTFCAQRLMLFREVIELLGGADLLEEVLVCGGYLMVSSLTLLLALSTYASCVRMNMWLFSFLLLLPCWSTPSSPLMNSIFLEF